MKTSETVIAIMIIVIILFTGCNRESERTLEYKALDYVELFDYRNLTVSRDFVQVTNDEIKTVIEADFDSRCIYKEVTERNTIQENDIILCDIIGEEYENNFLNYYLFTGSDVLSEEKTKELIGMKVGDNLYLSEDESKVSYVNIKGIYTFAQVEDEELVLEMYSCDNMEEVYEHVIEKTMKTIITNYALDKIMENSYIKILPEQAKKFVNKKLSEKESFDGDKAFEEYIGMTIQEYEEYNYSVYFEYLIYSAIAEKEEIMYSKEDYENTIEIIARESNVSKEKVLQMVDNEYIIYRTICDEVEEVVLNYVKVIE